MEIMINPEQRKLRDKKRRERRLGMFSHAVDTQALCARPFNISELYFTLGNKYPLSLGQAQVPLDIPDILTTEPH